MSEFSTLMTELQTLVDPNCEITCKVRVGDWFPRDRANDARSTAWRAMIEWPDNRMHWGEDGKGPPVIVRYGSTGEAALRNLVDAVRQGATS